MTNWTRAEDLVIGISYLQNGTEVTDQLLADLPEHAGNPGSIRMRLGNFQHLATNGQEGSASADEGTGAAYQALLGAVLFHQAVGSMTEQGWAGPDIAEAMHLPAEAFGSVIEYQEANFRHLAGV